MSSGTYRCQMVHNTHAPIYIWAAAVTCHTCSFSMYEREIVHTRDSGRLAVSSVPSSKDLFLMRAKTFDTTRMVARMVARQDSPDAIGLNTPLPRDVA